MPQKYRKGKDEPLQICKELDFADSDADGCGGVLCLCEHPCVGWHACGDESDDWLCAAGVAVLYAVCEFLPGKRQRVEAAVVDAEDAGYSGAEFCGDGAVYHRNA